ncbi:alpha/beta hydrolase family esterase [Bailinhaonella thermotolerans]|uniref:Polyhydroxybutyrate depolymerase n=1 Tax=Bailinhaonella thermotolerans TaxID=1070861 RepID=A0A3A4AXE1_9ACTN|nr:PHB depolymerase family esterase [Bailinhaonella thermotolerans]RJL32064.1 hypothetical protein D5H75_16680 [Bailinhaonella thermotolerans]
MRARCLTAVLAGVVLMLGACSSPGPSRTKSQDVAPGPAPAAAPRGGSPGCGKPLPPTTEVSADRDGVRLRYRLNVPRGFTNATPAPVVLNFHGLGSNAFMQDVYSRLPLVGGERGFIVVTPSSSTGLPGWVLPGLKGEDVADDGAEVKAAGLLLDHLEATLCVDSGREFATGMSNGAGMASALVCGLRGRLAAVAPVSGVNIAEPCPNPRPTSIVAFHGTGDQVIPYDGGPVSVRANYSGVATPDWLRDLRLPSVVDTMDRWARSLGCGRPVQVRVAKDIRLRRYPGCRDGATVSLYTVRGGGHTWPGSLPFSRATTTSIDATDVMLTAFEKAS